MNVRLESVHLDERGNPCLDTDIVADIASVDEVDAASANADVLVGFREDADYLVAGLRVSLCDNLALVTLLTAYGAAPESRVGSTSLEVLGSVVVYFLLVLVET